MPGLYNAAVKGVKMKQVNSAIASVLVSGLIVLGIVGIGVNALTNTNVAPTNINASGSVLTSNASVIRQSEGRHSRRTTGTTDDGEVLSTE